MFGIKKWIILICYVNFDCKIKFAWINFRSFFLAIASKIESWKNISIFPIFFRNSNVKLGQTILTKNALNKEIWTILKKNALNKKICATKLFKKSIIFICCLKFECKIKTCFKNVFFFLLLCLK